MKIGIIGAGNVGRALGGRLIAAGHEVTFGLVDPEDTSEIDELEGARGASVRGAVEAAEVVVLATPWKFTQDAVEAAGDFENKPLLDATNPIGPGFTLTHGHDDSGAEQVARWATNARVVKIFNTTGFENMKDPSYGDYEVMMLAACDDEDAREVALGLARDIGFEARWLGDLSHARLLEPMALVWIKLALVRGEGRKFAFGMLRRPEQE